MRHLVVLIAPLACLAVLAAQPLEIPEVVVTGQSSLRDTLRSQQRQDLDAYWRLAAPERFAYRYQPAFTTATPPADSAAHQGLASLDVGTPFLAVMRLAYADRRRPLLNFWSEAGMRQPDDDWETTRMRLAWRGNVGDSALRAGIAWTDHKTPLADATITWMTHTGGVDLRVLPLPAMRSLKLDYALHSFTEETAATSRDLNEADVRLRAEAGQPEWSGELDVAHLKSSLSAQARLRLASLPVLDEAGVWLAGDRDHLYGSLLLARRLAFGSRYPWLFSLHVFNTPGMGRTGRAGELRELPTRHLESTKLQVKRPLDLHVVLEHSSYLPLQLGYRLAMLQDDPTPVRTADSLYTLVPVDAWLHEVSLDAGYRYEWIEVDNTFTWRVSDPEQGDQLPWLPESENRFALRVFRDRWTAGIVLEWLAGRRNDLDLAMEDVVLVDIEAHYDLTGNLRLRGAIENLLDEPYRVYSLLPPPGLTLRAGFDYHF